ncbi:MAG: VCBS repeat-containing protein [Planctomycetota bacterium]
MWPVLRSVLVPAAGFAGLAAAAVAQAAVRFETVDLPLPARTLSPLALWVGDLDDDGDRDVLVDHNPVWVLRNDGTDAAPSYSDAVPLPIYRSTAGGLEAAGRARAFGSCPVAVAPQLADFDGDGVDDLVLGGLAVRWFRGLGGGRFAEPETVSARDGRPLESDGRPSGMAAVAWDGDAFPDLLVNVDSACLVLHRGGARGVGAAEPLEANGQPIRTGGWGAPWVGDFDGDGRRDLVVPGPRASLVLYRGVGALRGGGDGAPVLGPAERLVPEDPSAERVLLAVVDWEGDGRPDIVRTAHREEVVPPQPLSADEQAELAALGAELARVTQRAHALTQARPVFDEASLRERHGNRRALDAARQGLEAARARLQRKRDGVTRRVPIIERVRGVPRTREF